MHKLIIEDDEGRTTVVPLLRDELSIGRKEGNTIRLTERNVSRRHARLFKQDGGICVEDFGSYTGVRVNGVRISTPTTLRDSDQILIGDYKLSVRIEAASDVAPPTNPGLPLALGIEGAAGPVAVPSQARPGAAVHMDGSPTIPLHTLEEQGRAPHIASTRPARLVVVTTDLAGMEFRVDRPSLVIGRTEENDIILNHASISRHHAKIVRDGDRHTVVDLQSANGVRVAGESYERVDVQPGDVVELGHVKLRFVGAGEDWTFDPRDFAPRSRRNLKIGLAGGIVLAATLAFALQGKKLAPPAPVVATVAPQAPVTPSATALFADATTAVSSENWDRAVSALDLLLSRPTGTPDAEAVTSQALELKRKVDMERRSAELFTSFQRAVAEKEPDVALSRYDDIPADSVYKGRAEPELDGVKTLFRTAHLELADAARTQGRCDDAAAEAEKVQQIDPENRLARDIVKKCRQRPVARVVPAATPVTTPRSVPAVPVAVPHPTTAPTAALVRPPATTVASARAVPARPARVPPGTRVAGGPGSTPESSSAVSPPAENSQPDFPELIRQAREAWMHQQCGSAIDLSRRALKLRPGANDAHQIIAVCACSTKDRDGALRSYNRLDERSRAMVRTLCARNGVELIE